MGVVDVESRQLVYLEVATAPAALIGATSVMEKLKQQLGALQNRMGRSVLAAAWLHERKRGALGSFCLTDYPTRAKEDVEAMRGHGDKDKSEKMAMKKVGALSYALSVPPSA